MTWVRMDDHLPENVDLELDGDDAAGWFHFAAIAYCSRELTDGFVPDVKLPKLTNNPRWKKAVEKLIAVGWFIKVEGGIQVRHYTDYQSTRAEVEARRERDAERKRDARSKRPGKRPGNVRSGQRADSAGNPKTVRAVSTSTDSDTPTDPESGNPLNGKDLSTSTTDSKAVVASARLRAVNTPPEVAAAMDELRDRLPAAVANPDRFSGAAA
jgi:hypothetical protein